MIIIDDLLKELCDKTNTTVTILSERDFLFTSDCPSKEEMEKWLNNKNEWKTHNINQVLAGIELIGPFPLILIGADIRLYSNPQTTVEVADQVVLQ